MDGSNYFGNEEYFLRYVDTEKITGVVPLTDIIQRFQSDFDYMEKLRLWGYSFSPNV